MPRHPLALIAVLTALFGLPSAASAGNLYFTSTSSPTAGTVGTVDTDGSGLNDGLVTITGTYPNGIAVTDAALFYLDVTQSPWTGTLKRADLDGGNGSTLTTICSTAATKTYPNTGALATNGAYLYYACRTPSTPYTYAIGRIGLDGSGQDDEWLDLGSTNVDGLAVNATHAYFGTAGGLARVELTPGATPTTAAAPDIEGVAVSSSRVYWSTSTSGGSSPAIMRSDLDLTNQATVIGSLATDGSGGIAANDQYVFWANDEPGVSGHRISRVDVDGSNYAADFVAYTAGRAFIPKLALNAGGGTRTLTVEKAGAGAGTVTSAPTGIDCGATCAADFASGTSVTLTATPAAGSTFKSWSGACTGTAKTCTVTLSAAATATATFTAKAITIRSYSTIARSIAKLRVRTPSAGTLRLVGTRSTTRAAKRRGAGKAGKRRASTVRACATVKRVKRAGTTTLYCIPNRATRALLLKRSVRVTLRVTFTTSAGSRTSRLVRLTLPKRGVAPQPVTG